MSEGPPPGYGPPQGFVPPTGYGPPGYGPPGYGPPGYGAFPGYPPGPPPGLKPSSNIGWAIAAIFLFWPLCIPAFIAATKVDNAWFAGDWFGAQKASDDARRFGLIGVCVGGGLIALYLLFFLFIVAVAI